MTVHRPDPKCNMNTVTATYPESVLVVNARILADREQRDRERAAQHAAEQPQTPDQVRQHAEPTPTVRATQTSHDFALTLQEFTGGTEQQKPKPLSVKKAPLPQTPEQDIVARMIGSGNNALKAISAALAFTTKYRHGIQTCDQTIDGTGFASDGWFQPEEGQARALTFVRVLLNAPTFARYRGHGGAFVDQLASVLGGDELDLLTKRLWCATEDLLLAADQVRTLIGENVRSVAALAMDRVEIPPHILVRIQHFDVVRSVVTLVAALVQVAGKRDGVAFVSIADAASIIGKDQGSIARAFRIAVERGALERVSRGSRKHANAPGVASEYRVPWIMPT